MMRSPIIYTSSWLRQSKETAIVAEQLCSALDCLGIGHEELQHTNDYWCRDYMPVEVCSGLYASYRYNPDYLQEKKQYITDQKDACQDVDIRFLSDMGIVFDGGNYVRCDGKILMTDKVLTENAGYYPSDLLHHLQNALGGKIILLPWDMSEPCGHSDGMVADLGDGRILLNVQRDKEMAARLHKILEAHFEVVELHYDCKPHADDWCYLNFLRIPGAILLPSLSEHADSDNDRAALQTFSRIFPDLEIVPIYSLPLIRQGGALHCVTWEFYPSENAINPVLK